MFRPGPTAGAPKETTPLRRPSGSGSSNPFVRASLIAAGLLGCGLLFFTVDKQILHHGGAQKASSNSFASFSYAPATQATLPTAAVSVPPSPTPTPSPSTQAAASPSAAPSTQAAASPSAAPATQAAASPSAAPSTQATASPSAAPATQAAASPTAAPAAAVAPATFRCGPGLKSLCTSSAGGAPVLVGLTTPAVSSGAASAPAPAPAPTSAAGSPAAASTPAAAPAAAAVPAATSLAAASTATVTMPAVAGPAAASVFSTPTVTATVAAPAATATAAVATPAATAAAAPAATAAAAPAPVAATAAVAAPGVTAAQSVIAAPTGTAMPAASVTAVTASPAAALTVATASPAAVIAHTATPVVAAAPALIRASAAAAVSPLAASATPAEAATASAPAPAPSAIVAAQSNPRVAYWLETVQSTIQKRPSVQSGTVKLAPTTVATYPCGPGLTRKCLVNPTANSSQAEHAWTTAPLVTPSTITETVDSQGATAWAPRAATSLVQQQYNAQSIACQHNNQCNAYMKDCASWNSQSCDNVQKTCAAVLGVPAWPGNNCSLGVSPATWTAPFAPTGLQTAQLNCCLVNYREATMGNWRSEQVLKKGYHPAASATVTAPTYAPTA